MISLQTNVDSLAAQHNLNLDNQFQSNTIQQLTSGYRINRSGDDAAGLAISNGIQNQLSQLNQGVNNANDGVSQLQIVDGGLSNISTILNRLQTLATESGSSTFTGSRSTLNQEYTGLLSEIDRQASNVNLATGGSFNKSLNVFIGGGSDTNNSTVSIDLSGAQNAVDATSLGLAGTNVLGGGTAFSGNSVNLDEGKFLNGSNATASFQFNTTINGTAATHTVTVNGAAGGISGSDVLAQLNTQLSALQLGITAGVGSSGAIEFSGATAFNVKDTSATPSLVTPTTATTGGNYVLYGITNPNLSDHSDSFGVSNYSVDDIWSGPSSGNTLATWTNRFAFDNSLYGSGYSAVVDSQGTGINLEAPYAFEVNDINGSIFGHAGTFEAATQTTTTTTSGSAANNTSNYLDQGATTFTAPASANNGETLSFQAGGKSFSVNLTNANAGNVTSAINTINAASSPYGVSAVLNTAGTGIDFQSSSAFTVGDAFTATGIATPATAGVFGSAGVTSATAPTTSVTANADTAITAINSAIQKLGLVQGVVGAGENTLNYALSLAQSQISNFSSAESNIKDADIASQAANLSKSQVLTQTAVAALAQANSEPQAILKLLQ